jgi:hypothetical protein
MSRLHAYADAVLPGLGLVAQGRWAALGLLGGATAGLGAALILDVLNWRIAGIGLWAASAVTAVSLRWWLARRARPDPERITGLARTTLAAWLTGGDPGPSLNLLLKAVPDEPGAWDLAGRIAAERGDRRLAARARARLARLATR